MITSRKLTTLTGLALVAAATMAAGTIVTNQAAEAGTIYRTKSVLGYVPPNRGKPTRGIRATGSRGCSAPVASAESSAMSEALDLTLLVPGDHVGQTTVSHPSFFWYVSNVPAMPVEFSLIEPGVAQPLWVKQVKIDRPGVMKVNLPKDQPGLEVGKQYRWSVSLVCNAERRSTDVYTQGRIERVANPDLANQVNVTVGELDKAAVYARSGLWYDALQASFAAYTNNANDRRLYDEFLTLLDQGGLAQVVIQERSSRKLSGK